MIAIRCVSISRLSSRRSPLNRTSSVLAFDCPKARLPEHPLRANLMIAAGLHFTVNKLLMERQTKLG